MLVLKSIRALAAPAAAKINYGIQFRSVSGTVKWYNSTKGFGFITPDNEGADVFVHQSSIQSEGFRFLNEGERVDFEVTETDRGLQAISVTGADGSPLKRDFQRTEQ